MGRRQGFGSTNFPETGDGTRVIDADDPSKTESGTQTLAERFATFTAAVRKKVAATENWTTPERVKIPGSNRYAYLTAPERLKRIFDSPLARTGVHATGEEGERKVTSGWGDSPNSVALNTGLNFPGTYGENVLACAGGRVEFVGYMSVAKGAAYLPDARQNAEGDVYTLPTGTIVAKRVQVAAGGIVIRIRHDGDFPGYMTEYYHLSATNVGVGDPVSDSQVIGELGSSGNVTEPQLHLTVSYSSGGHAVVVAPSTIVPNRYKGHVDSTNAPETALKANLISPGPGGKTLIEGIIATALGTIDRGTDLQNADRESVTAAQSGHTSFVAQTAVKKSQQLFEAKAKYQAQGLVVLDAMTYNFQTGEWYLGDVPNGPV